MGNPWLSVIIPTYNGEAYLGSALDSVIAQQDDQIEIIAVDDGSTDTTVQILKSYESRLPLRIFRRARIGNWVANTNYGLAFASGNYVCFLHQDDLWLANRLHTLRSLLERTPSATMLLHPSWFIDCTGRRVGLWRCPLPVNGGGLKPEFVVKRLLVQNFISMPAPVFSRDAALSVGGLDENLWYTADWDFWLKLASAGKTIYDSHPLSAFRIHPLSQTIQGSRSIDDFEKQYDVVLNRHLDAWCSSHRGGQLLRRVVHYSVEVNTTLAAHLHGRRVNTLRLIWRFLRLGPLGWHLYLRDSRILERAVARYRIGLV